MCKQHYANCEGAVPNSSVLQCEFLLECMLFHLYGMPWEVLHVCLQLAVTVSAATV